MATSAERTAIIDSAIERISSLTTAVQEAAAEVARLTEALANAPSQEAFQALQAEFNAAKTALDEKVAELSQVDSDLERLKTALGS